MPNPWDIGSARVLAKLGFPALATTSAGFAWSIGKADNHVRLEEALAHLYEIASAVEVPVNADFEGGFAIEPVHVVANVKRATETGIAGLSIEDSTRDPAEPLFPFSLAVERIQAAREAIEARENTIFVSLAAIWELAAKAGRGRLPGFEHVLRRGPEGVRDDLAAAGLNLLPIELDHALAAAILPLHHHDPFDRIMIAQAKSRSFTVITRDRMFARYGVQVLAT